MYPISIQQTLLNCKEGRVVLASDAQHRQMLGVSPVAGESGSPMFVQIDRVTMLDLERGVVDLRTAMTQRCSGIVVAA
ncbi:MAG TPA: hypothetical protein VGP22_09380 [Albitalea sp.]|nr:hypothetical protein [Albitalea sp.]